MNECTQVKLPPKLMALYLSLPGPGGGGINFPHGFFTLFGVVKVFGLSLFTSYALPLGPSIQRTSV